MDIERWKAQHPDHNDPEHIAACLGECARIAGAFLAKHRAATRDRHLTALIGPRAIFMHDPHKEN